MVSSIYGDVFISQISDGLFNFAKINYDYDEKNNWNANICFEYESFIFQEKKSFYQFQEKI